MDFGNGYSQRKVGFFKLIFKVFVGRCACCYGGIRTKTGKTIEKVPPRNVDEILFDFISGNSLIARRGRVPLANISDSRYNIF